MSGTYPAFSTSLLITSVKVCWRSLILAQALFAIYILGTHGGLADTALTGEKPCFVQRMKRQSGDILGMISTRVLTESP